ncbi:MAG: protein kinase [Lachnospiraceae bacterium]
MEQDKFINQFIDKRYKVMRKINSGNVGSVYYAEDTSIQDVKAIKFIPKVRIERNKNWKQEIIKVNQLAYQPGIVKFHKFDETKIGDEEYIYIIWDYIPGKSLRQLIENKEVTMQLLINVIETALKVFFACGQLGIQHGDFHSGNILIQDANELSFVPNVREVWITDFGYGTFSNEIPPMDDYKGLARIIQQSLEVINVHTLEKEDRIKYIALKNEFPKYLLEENGVEEEYARNPRKLHEKMLQMFVEQPDLSGEEKNVGDYLAAELIGDRYDEWDALFVPKFLAVDDLLDRNICVLTGLRGCGKTMMFRRLSFDFQSKLGKSGIRGEDGFVGFYLNARTIAEAFPWLPDRKESDARKQVINFFHLKCIIEVLSWLKLYVKEELDWAWLYQYFSAFYDTELFITKTVEASINSVLECCNDELQRSKLDDRYVNQGWHFTDYDCLECFMGIIQKNCPFAFGKSFYFFLDDYSTPLVTEATQHIINPIIFRRNSVVYFKISTESTESIEKVGLNGKILEDGADYKLIELGMASLTQKVEDVSDIISAIFEKRIKRSYVFSNFELRLQNFLGNTQLSNNERANKIRENDRQTLYYGIEDFCAIWSSDIRELIKIFAEMVSTQGESSLEIKKQKKFAEECQPIIDIKIQDRVLREAGGHFVDALPTAVNPSRRKEYKKEKKYGEHLYDIVMAIQEMAYCDLQNKDSKNQDKKPPKQARKIELTSANGKLTEEARDYYRGLIRYGVFVQDYRAKSVRGTVATRLYLRSLLIPYFRITFSKRDCITLDWEDFEKLLLMPNEFKMEYKKKIRKNKENIEGQISFEI